MDTQAANLSRKLWVNENAGEDIGAALMMPIVKVSVDVRGIVE